MEFVSKGETVCTSAGWDDIVVFLMANYLAHAATSVKFPEETSWEVNKRRMDALLAPYIGLMYALRKIQWCWVLETDSMRRACRAEALCQIVRTEHWRPKDGSSIEVPYVELEINSKLQAMPRRCVLDFKHTHQKGPGRPLPYMITGHKLPLVEGIESDSLPPGYGIQRCQGTPTLQIHRRRNDMELSGEHRTTESVIALAQIIFATVSVYKSRGDQFERYGYAAFSLTVLPFAVMSFANLIASILSLDYARLHLVETPELIEAQERGAIVMGVVGKLQTEVEPTLEVTFHSVGNILLAQGRINSKFESLGKVTYKKEICSSLSQQFRDTLIIIQSHKPALETPSPKSIRQYLRSEFGSYLALVIGLSLFTSPSVIIWALTRFNSRQSEIVDQVGLLLWLYLQQAILLFLLAWNAYFKVGHALHADSRYTSWLEPVLGYLLRATGMLGYALVVRQIVAFGVCIQT